jgi:hypothetical protein
MYVMLEAVRNILLSYVLEGGRQQVFTFVPGKNKIDPAIWECIQKQHAKAFADHYGKLLHPFDTQFDTGTKAHLNHYNHQEMLEIVANAGRGDFLEYLLQVERERTLGFMPRFAVLDAILDKIPAKHIDPAELDALGAQYRNYTGRAL